MAKPHHLFLLLLLLCATLEFSSSSPSDHLYNVGELVPLFVNKVGPFNNPSETYEYYDLPFCTPDPIVRKKESLGEVLNGDRLSNALYEFKFLVDKIDETWCQKKLTIDQIATFKRAINRDFYFQFYLDDLPLWGFIGKLEEDGWTPGGGGPNYYLFTHVQFDVLYNGNRIIQVNAFGDPNRAADITKDVGVDVKFTYSIIWNATKVRFENRMDRYLRASLMPVHQQVHWFSFVNSIVIILLLIGLLALLYMRHLRSDLKKYSNANEEDNEVGWKSLQHGDVFRPPPNSSLLFAVVGTGTQLLILLCVLLFLALIGTLYPYNRGGLLNWLVLLYALSSVFAGYTAASFHGLFAENGWERSASLAAILYTGPVFVVASILNIVAISYRATIGLPFGSIIVILVLLTFLAIPLLAFGGVIGYRFRSKFQSSSATKRHPRDIQQLAWYRRTPFLMFIGGLVPFSAIVLQLHQAYASMWGYKIYTLPSILFATFIPVILIIALVSIGLTYIQLSAEDHEWWWRSVLCGGSTAIFMFGYCVYFYVRSNMSGFLQLSFFIGYNACLCYAFFLIFGAISFRVSLLFVRHIYHDVKRE
ncbi:transmembrane 9 superfamily member 5 [Glycine soja]|uniref:Transmembrane 9 superfamily member n=1 Tax=Glycine soja TaxID=3848 RepID=A0A445HMM6_GLYSO|nr:transmembrane 9 superfamily member 5 [Glycine soja]RZB75017.1 Transmembrane 9 superfamily member 5 isoform A [Glycine soja]